MAHLRKFKLASDGDENAIITNEHRTCFNGVYPLKIFPQKRLEWIEFGNITCFYGSNGSGKTTLLNIIGEKLNVIRHSEFSNSAFFSTYLKCCEAFGTVPENSLSIKYQLDLAKYIEDSARFYNCQFIISTHSPVFLSLKDALVYNLDKSPVITEKWTKLENVRKYYDFFKSHEAEFEND